MLLKDTSKPYNFRSPVKVNGIGDGVYFEIATNWCLLHQEQTAINRQNRAFSKFLDGSYCNRNINNGIT